MKRIIYDDMENLSNSEYKRLIIKAAREILTIYILTITALYYIR